VPVGASRKLDEGAEERPGVDDGGREAVEKQEERKRNDAEHVGLLTKVDSLVRIAR